MQPLRLLPAPRPAALPAASSALFIAAASRPEPCAGFAAP
jgi:hypothetical protein